MPNRDSKRRRQLAGARGGADQRETFDRQLDGARARADAGDNLDAKILHRRVQALLDDRQQAVDLVDEQDVAFLQRRQDARQIAFALQRRPGRHAHLGSHFIRQQIRERRLPQTRRTRQKDMVERVAAAPGRLHVHRQVVDDFSLPDELVETPRAKRGVLVAIAFRGRHHPFWRRRVLRGRLRSSGDDARSGGDTLGSEKLARDPPDPTGA